jgi:hypothetical protein
MTAITPRQRILQRKGALDLERASWISHWREISEYQQPRLGRYFVTDTNKGVKRHTSIYDNTPIYASRTLAAGMMSGTTSPARPWFKLGLSDKQLAKVPAVKQWLFDVTRLMLDVFQESNTYRALHQGYEELGLFGTWATIVLPDFENVLHHFPLTIGEYAIGTDYKGRPNTIVREFQMPVASCVEQFGVKNVSQTVKNLYDTNRLDQWVPVIHIIEPNSGRDLTKRDNRNMRFSSHYMESGSQNDSQFLSESGFKRFPALCPRWTVTGGDIYGGSPGMEVLGDVKQLQHSQLRKAQAIDYKVNPPLQVPTAYKDAARSRLPGGVMFVDSSSPGGGVRSAFEVNLDMQHLLLDIQDIRQRINQGYYADLFLMLANDTRSGITATEVAERHEEKLLMLGPVLERLHDELLGPMVRLTFDYLLDAGTLPPPPPELQGRELVAEFISTLAQAMRVVSGQSMDRLLGTVGSMAALNPGAVDKIDFDAAIDEYADLYAVNPKIVVPTAVAQQMRAQRQQAQATQAAAASAPALAAAIKTAGETNLNGAQQVLGSLQGYTQ